MHIWVIYIIIYIKEGIQKTPGSTLFFLSFVCVYVCVQIVLNAANKSIVYRGLFDSNSN